MTALAILAGLACGLTLAAMVAYCLKSVFGDEWPKVVLVVLTAGLAIAAANGLKWSLQTLGAIP